MKPIATALCSFGMSGRLFHAPFIHVHQGFQLYGVWERSKNLAEEIYPGIKTFRSLEDMLNDNNIELVIVNTPNFSHFEYAKKALLAGKHVIVEKPFTVTSSEGQELIDLSNKLNRKIVVYHNRRYDSDFRAVRQVVNDNLIGEIAEAEIHFDRFKLDLSPKVHKETPGPGRGALYDLGSHLIDQALQLFGWPETLYADIRIMRPESKVDDYFEVLLYYPNLRVRLKSSYLVREALPGYQLHGFGGSFIKPRTDNQENLLLEGKIPGSEGWGTEKPSDSGILHCKKNGEWGKWEGPHFTGNYLDFFDEVYHCIRDGALNPVPPGQGLQVIRIIEKAFESNQLRAAVSC